MTPCGAARAGVYEPSGRGKSIVAQLPGALARSTQSRLGRPIAGAPCRRAGKPVAAGLAGVYLAGAMGWGPCSA